MRQITVSFTDEQYENIKLVSRLTSSTLTDTARQALIDFLHLDADPKTVADEFLKRVKEKIDSLFKED